MSVWIANELKGLAGVAGVMRLSTLIHGSLVYHAFICVVNRGGAETDLYVAATSRSDGKVVLATGLVAQNTGASWQNEYEQTTPAFGASGNRLYFVERHGSVNGFFLGAFDLDGGNWIKTLFLAGTAVLLPTLAVDDDWCYIAYARMDEMYHQVYVARCAHDGSGFSELQVTSHTSSCVNACLRIHGSKLYVGWLKSGTPNLIQFARCDNDLTNLSGETTVRSTSSTIASGSLDLVVDPSGCYFAWSERFDGVYQISMARCDLDGGNLVEVLSLTTGLEAKYPHLGIGEAKLHYSWLGRIVGPGSPYNVWTGASDFAGGNFVGVCQTNNPDKAHYIHNLAVYGDTEYVTWRQSYDYVASGFYGTPFHYVIAPAAMMMGGAL